MSGFVRLSLSPSALDVAVIRICLDDPPTALDRDFHHPARLPSCVPPSRAHPGTGM